MMKIVMIIISRRNTSVRGRGGGRTGQNVDWEADCTHNGWPVKKQKRGRKEREREEREEKR